MQKTRQRIAEYLSDHRFASAKALGHALGKTDANIRYHLSLMEQEGRVEVAWLKRLRRRGRPTKFFSLTSAARDPQIVHFARLMWEELLGKPGSRKRSQLFERLAERLANSPGRKAGPLAQQLYFTIQALERLGYDVQWEAHAEAPRIRMRDCPFSSLPSDPVEACELDQVLLQHLLGLPVEQLASRRPGPEGPQDCVFRVQQKNTVTPR